MIYDSLLDEAYTEGLTIKERPFNTYDGRIKNKNIYLRTSLSNIEKSCVLAEELGHYYTTVGNILDQSKDENRKQEYHARMWGYDRCIGLQGIIKAYKSNLTDIDEMADFFNVTPQYLSEAIECYHKKYGICTTVDNHIIYFEPCLAVMEII